MSNIWKLNYSVNIWKEKEEKWIKAHRGTMEFYTKTPEQAEKQLRKQPLEIITDGKFSDDSIEKKDEIEITVHYAT